MKIIIDITTDKTAGAICVTIESIQAFGPEPEAKMTLALLNRLKEIIPEVAKEAGAHSFERVSQN